MATEVILPKVDMDMATGRISRWFAREGERVTKGEPLFEIETDKAAMEVDAPASGTLRAVTGGEGVDIAVGAPVAWIYAEDEAFEGGLKTEGGTGATDGAAPVAVGPDPDVEVDARMPAAAETAAVTGRAASDAAKAPPSPEGDGPSAADAGERRGVRATPLARRIARERGIDLAAVVGHGPMGRIGREDVERAADAAPASIAGGRSAEARAAGAETAGTGPAGATLQGARPTRTLPAETAEGAGPARSPRVETASEAAAAPPAMVGASASSPASMSAPAPGGAQAPSALVSLRGGEGTPIVLVHGFGSESASWRPLVAELGDAGGPVLGVDLAGHGASVDREVGCFADLVAGVEDALVAAGVTDCHLVGHSLGGAVAASVAAGTTIGVRSLTLLAPAGFGPDIDTGFAEGFAAATGEAPIRQWLRHLVADPASLSDGFVRATARARADGRHASAQTRLAPALFSNGTQHFEVRSLLPHLAMPVAIVAGAEDRVVPVRHFGALPGMIALHVFPRTGHLPQIERRSEVAQLLRRIVR